jgi:hypothetical protein
MYTKMVQDRINKELAKIDYVYDEIDGSLLREMFEKINDQCGSSYHYLCEIANRLTPNASKIVLEYFDRFHSEGVRAFLLPQLLYDKNFPDARIILNGYLRFKNSPEYISGKDKPSSAYIYVRYDNALKKLKPKKLKTELESFVAYPRDVIYLPFTMRMLASWKSSAVEAQLGRYFNPTKITAQEFGLPEDSADFFPPVSSMRKELLFFAIAASVYYPSRENIANVQKYLVSDDQNLRMAAQKAIKKIYPK